MQLFSVFQMKRNLVPANNFQILFTTRHLTSWAENFARYEIRWDDTNAVVMVKKNIIHMLHFQSEFIIFYTDIRV